MSAVEKFEVLGTLEEIKERAKKEIDRWGEYMIDQENRNVGFWHFTITPSYGSHAQISFSIDEYNYEDKTVTRTLVYDHCEICKFVFPRKLESLFGDRKFAIGLKLFMKVVCNIAKRIVDKKFGKDLFLEEGHGSQQN